MSQSMSLCVRACAALVLSVCAVAQETGEVSVLRAVRGREARLPCGPGRVFLDGPGSYVLWLKNERDILHRYPSERPDHPSVCVQEQCAEGTALVLPGVTEQEAGRYRCRVHYVASPSVDYVLQLRLVESPGAPRIYDGAGVELREGHVGPLPLGADLTLVCELNDGDPDTVLYWRRDGVPVEGGGAVTGAGATRRVVARAGSTTRGELGALYECVADNADVSEPTVSAVRVRLYLAPLSVEIRMNNNVDFEAGQPRVVDCVVVGCAPPPTVTWHLGGVALRPNVHKELHDGNYTVSSLTLAPALREAGRELVCRAHNAHLPTGVYEDRVTINVGYRPVCVPGGEDTVGAVPQQAESLSCAVDASPEPLQFAWTFADSTTLYTGVTRVPGHRHRYTTTLRWVSREGELGPLLCRATNSFGEQRRPCRYTVSPGGPPQPPQCVLLTAEAGTLRVQCKRGWDGGRAQRVHLVVYEAGGAVLHNVSDSAGHFVVRGVDLSGNITARVYATSARGASAHTLLSASAHTHTGGVSRATGGGGVSRWLVVCGGVGALSLVVVGVVCARWVCGRTRRDPDLVPRADGTFYREPDFTREERATTATNITVNQLTPCGNQYVAPGPGACRVLLGPAATHSYYV